MACENYGNSTIPESGSYNNTEEGAKIKGSTNGSKLMNALYHWCCNHSMTNPKEVTIGIASAIFQESSWRPDVVNDATTEEYGNFCATGIVQWVNIHYTKNDTTRQQKICNYINTQHKTTFIPSKFKQRLSNGLEKAPMEYQVEAVIYECNGDFAEKPRDIINRLKSVNDAVTASNIWTQYFEGLKSNKQKELHSRHIPTVRDTYKKYQSEIEG